MKLNALADMHVWDIYAFREKKPVSRKVLPTLEHVGRRMIQSARKDSQSVLHWLSKMACGLNEKKMEITFHQEMQMLISNNFLIKKDYKPSVLGQFHTSERELFTNFCISTQN